MNYYLEFFTNLYDRIEKRLHGNRSLKYYSYLFLCAFFVSITIIQLNVMGLLPKPLDSLVATNHLYAINLVLNLILIKELMDMIFAMSYSVSRAQRVQLEVLSLILLRSSFKELTSLDEIQNLTATGQDAVIHILSYGFSSFVVFIIVLLYSRLSSIPMLLEENEKASFVNTKKILSLFLFLNFLMIILFDIIRFFDTLDFNASIETFFEVFLFADIAIVLISMGYSQLYFTVFRNTGFALATVLIRIALTSPHYMQEAIAILAGILAYSLAFAYNKYCIECQVKDDK